MQRTIFQISPNASANIPGVCRAVAVWCLLLAASQFAESAELAVLGKQNWSEWAPKGKEVDAIYGDLVLRNDQIICVVARPIASRNANMTVKGVGGAIIDLSNRKYSNDQLSAFYPGGSRFSFAKEKSLETSADGKLGALRDSTLQGDVVSLKLESSNSPKGLRASLQYSLREKQGFVLVQTTIHNTTDKPIPLTLGDAMRADRSFKFGSVAKRSFFWAADEWFRQCYGVVAPEMQIKHKGSRLVTIEYRKPAGETVVPANGMIAYKRRIFPAAHLLRARGIADRMGGQKVVRTSIEVADANGLVQSAKVTVKAGGETLGWARTSKSGKLQFAVAAAEYDVEVEAVGRPTVRRSVKGPISKIELETCGYLQGTVKESGGGHFIPCKIAIHDKADGGGTTPFYGPDSAAGAVHNLLYPANGKFKCELAPGEYEVIVSRGPEYDAHFATVVIKRNETTTLNTELRRVVNSAGWVSADFHSHSSPSGDNTGSQLGRVQNLLGENIEFAPCTEHNRVSSYRWHLENLQAGQFMATCSGIELTGNPLPINHQNAFPIRLRSRTQDGGGPLVDANPVTQIERLALWDDGSPKLVQSNHPNLVQMLGDKDLDGKFDGGFRGMFGRMDVIEVHPPAGIFSPPAPAPVKQLSRNPIFHWLQMFNLGYRIPGVVNTDAHYNFHGSGWIRNYIKCSTDEPANIETMEIVKAAEQGLVIMTTGPYLEVSASSNGKNALPGQDLASNGQVALQVRVQCSNWLDINRVQVFVNGRPRDDLNFTRRTHPKMFKDQVVKFDEIIKVELAQDAHVVVATIGEGIQLGRVAGPRWGTQAPVAVANPVFVDVDGGGFKPNGDLLDLPIPLK